MATKQKKKPVEVVVFNNPAKKKKKQDPEESKKSYPAAGKKSKSYLARGKGDEPVDTAASPSFIYDPKQAKYDIRKLAIQSMKHTAKDKAMVDLLVELGAKPPKNKCLHPRDYLEQLKRKRAEEKEEELANGDATGTKKKQKRKRRRDKDDLLNFVDGQKGWYKDGVQYMDSETK